MRVFVDTSAWIALLAPKDTHHANAERAFAQILEDNILVVTSNYIVDETVTWLRMRAGYAVAVSFRSILRESENSNRLHMAWVTESVEEKAWEIFMRHPGLKLSLTDCTSAVIAANLKLPVWSYDSDFAALGFCAWPDLR